MESLLLGSVANGDNREILKSSREIAGLLIRSSRARVSKPPDSLPLRWVEVEPTELFEVGDPEERVADLDGVVEERERALAGHGGEPERELGHLGGDRILVDAVEAVVDDLAAGEDDLLVGGSSGEVGEPSRRTCLRRGRTRRRTR